MTAANLKRNQDVFGEELAQEVVQIGPPSIARPNTAFKRAPVTRSVIVAPKAEKVGSSNNYAVQDDYSLGQKKMDVGGRRPQTAATRSDASNSFANEIGHLLSAANSLATSWLVRKEQSDVMPHKEDSNEVSLLYERAGLLLRQVILPGEMVKLCRLILLLPYEKSCKGVFVASCLKLFELSRKPTNDVHFHQESLFEPLLMVLSHAQMYEFEEVSYVLGTIRNLAVDSTSQILICKADGIKAVSNLLKDEIYDAMIQDGQTKEKVLVEVTGVLRNLAVAKKFQKEFVGVVELLCGLMFHFPMNANLMLNVARIISKLSLHQFCRAAITAYPPNIEVFLQLLAIHDSNLALAVRICFILGNLTVSNDENRKRIGLEFSGASITLSILDLAVYRDGELTSKLGRLSTEARSAALIEEDTDLLRRDQDDDEDEEEAERLAAEALDQFDFDDENKEQNAKKISALSAQFKDNEDLLVKLIRLIGNMGINSNVGSVLSRHPTAAVLIELLVSKSAKVSQCEELVLNIVATITNLSFYQHENNVFYKNHKHIQRFLLPLLFNENQEMVMEAVRALGNFSRDPEFRSDMMQTRGDEAMVVLLDHADFQVVFAVCGVLVNLSSDPAHRATIVLPASLAKLLEVLERGSVELPEASALSVVTVVSKVLINLCLDAPSAPVFTDSQEADEEIILADNVEQDNTRIIAVKPNWLDAAYHEKLFLQLHDILGQLPADHESLKEFVSKEGRTVEWEDLLRDVVSVCTSLLDLIGEPESLHSTFQNDNLGDAFGANIDTIEQDDEDLFGDRDEINDYENLDVEQEEDSDSI